MTPERKAGKFSWEWFCSLVLAFVASAALPAGVFAQGPPQQTGTYTESFEDPLGGDLTIDGPDGLASQPCPEGASQSATDCARGRRRSVNGPVCPFDEPFVTSLTGVKLKTTTGTCTPPTRPT